MDKDVGRLFVHCIEIRIIPMFNVIDLRTYSKRQKLALGVIDFFVEIANVVDHVRILEQVEDSKLQVVSS